MEYVAQTTKETKLFAQKLTQNFLAKKRKKALVVGLFGNLGSGKTAFTQGFAQALGVKKTVPSPTFILERIYKIKKKQFRYFIHIDVYRLKGVKELDQLGWRDIIKKPDHIIFIEWADRIARALPRDTIKIFFEYKGERERKIIIHDN